MGAGDAAAAFAGVAGADDKPDGGASGERNAPEVPPDPMKSPPPPVVMGGAVSAGGEVVDVASSAGGGAALSLLPPKIPPTVLFVLFQPFSTVEHAERGPIAKANPTKA